MKHGSLYCYTRLGCRCEPCRQAQSDYKRKLLSDPRVREASNRSKARQQRLERAARRWLAEHRPDVLQTLEREVA